MKKITIDAQTLCTKYGITEVSHGLSLYLTNLIRGRAMTDHSWLYELVDDKKVLADWIDIMTAANMDSPFGEEFCKFDLKQVEKFGPQGGIPPIKSKEVWDVIEPLYSSSRYDSPLELSEWFPVADEFGKKLFGSGALRGRPLPPKSVVEDMRRRDTLTTNSGFPRFTRRFKTKQEEIQDASSLKALKYPAVVLLRYYYGKLRPVWMFPMSTNLIEAGYQIPIQNAIRDSYMTEPVNPSAYTTPWRGFQYVKRTLTMQWCKDVSLISGDTTKMDAHMRPAQLRLVYEIVKWYFQRKYWAGLEASLMYVNDIDLLFYKEKEEFVVLEGVHGLASGSCWTQLSETVLQLFMAYVAETTGQGIGDDFYWLSDMSADDLVEFLDQFGLPANPAKQSVSTEFLTFLQRYYHKSFFSREDSRVLGAYYPTIRALGSMLWPENYHKPEDWSSDMFCARNYMILENCVDDPCFDEFVKFTVSGHRDMIPFAKKAFNDHAFADDVQKRARRIPGLWPSYNQEKLDQPLWSFTSIGLAATL